MQNVPQTKRQHFWKESNWVNLVLCINSGPERGFKMEYHYSENTRKSALRDAPLFEAYLEFVWNELKKNYESILCIDD